MCVSVLQYIVVVCVCVCGWWDAVGVQCSSRGLCGPGAFAQPWWLSSSRLADRGLFSRMLLLRRADGAKSCQAAGMRPGLSADTQSGKAMTQRLAI